MLFLLAMLSMGGTESVYAQKSKKQKSRRRSTPIISFTKSDFKIENNIENFKRILEASISESKANAKTISLKEAIQYALKDSLSYNLSKLDLKEAKYTYRLQKNLYYFPYLQTTGSSLSYDEVLTGIDNKKSAHDLSFSLVGEIPYAGIKYSLTPLSLSQTTQDIYADSHLSEMSVTLEMPLINGFGPMNNLLSFENQELDFDSMKENTRQAKYSTIANIVNKYWDLYRASYNLYTQSINLKISNKHYQSVKTQIKLGKFAESEIVRAESNMQFAKSSHYAAVASFFSSHISFISELGYKPSELDVIFVPLPTDEELAVSRINELNIDNPQGLYKSALKAQPAVKASNNNLTKLKNIKKLSSLTRYPDLSLVAKSSMTGESADKLQDAKKDAEMGESRENYVGVQLTWNYTFAGNDTEYQAAKVNYLRQSLQHDHLKNQLKAQVDATVRQVKSLQNAYKGASKAVRAAEQAFLYDIEKFNSGLVNQNVILDAQKFLIEARVFEIDALSSLKSSIISLDSLIGDMSHYYSKRKPASLSKKKKSVRKKNKQKVKKTRKSKRKTTASKSSKKRRSK